MITNNCPLDSTSTVDTRYCIKASSGSTYAYSNPTTKTFSLTTTKDSTIYVITNDSAPTAVVPITCSTGFIVVPGSTIYGTSDFCVMKYEAKNVSGVATSQAALTPWVSISQTSAITTAATACTGCHLITEAEWLTIAQNVLSVASNWSGGLVGSGYIYSGHNDNLPNSALVADSSDANGYAGETNTGGNQRRTLTLTNGNVIWDLAGNAAEWTAGQTNGTTAQQPGVIGNNYASNIEWPNVTTHGSLSPDPFPATTGLTGAGSWSHSNGIGMIVWSSTTDTALHGFIRGGNQNNGMTAGVLALELDAPPSYVAANLGFRASK